MDVSIIRERIQSITDMSSIYLLEALSDTAGFFSNEGRLLYVAKDIYSYSFEGIETDYLKLQTHVRISSVDNNPTFKDDYYNIIVYKGSLDDEDNLISFVQICSMHACNSDELSFKEFFYSLIALFQLPKEQAFKNILGLYGELKFMEYAYNQFHVDVSGSWHRRGPYSQYDFSNGSNSIEIKTTLSDSCEVSIKHQQIFGDHPCFLVIMVCEQYDNGETVDELIQSMYDNKNAFKSVNFGINLAKELKRVSVKDAKELHFIVREILFYNTIDINPFPCLPDNVNKLSYNLDYTDLVPLGIDDVSILINQFQ